MSISIYLVLLIVLLLFNLVFWVLVIWFRILFDCDFGKCCGRSSTDDSDTTSGHRNLGFVDTEDLYNSRPSTISERMESPPSYEEAIKYEQLCFHSSTPVYTSSSQSSPVVATATSSRSDVSHESTHASSPGRSTVQLSQSPPRLPELVRSRSSTAGSNSILTPIREEEIDDMPVTVVIDCIGVQASRLLENCDTKLDISNGENLHGHSKC